LSAVVATAAAAIPEAETGTTRTKTSIRNLNMTLTLKSMLSGGQYFIDEIGGHYFIYKEVSIL
jgi:hypothetical protein